MLTFLSGGIGPTDQLNVVKNSADGETMIGSDSWINLPVGYNLNDHVGVRMPEHSNTLRKIADKKHRQTDIEIAHPDVVFYDYYAAWNKPIVEDKDQYLSKLCHSLREW